VNEIKRSKLEWAGHMCMKQNSMIKKMLQENPRNKRPLGRPRLRWKNCVRKDFLNIAEEDNGHRDWKEVAENKEWKRICCMAR